jgi:hypothetical protein
MKNGKARFCLLVFTLVVLSLPACTDKSKLGQVEGRIFFRVEPVGEGTVTFFDERGNTASADLDSTGRYTLKATDGGLPEGEYTVIVIPPRYQSNSNPDATVMVEKAVPNIPMRHRRAETTKLRASVVPGANTIDFELNQ